MQAWNGERSLSLGRESHTKASAVVSKKKKIQRDVLDQRKVGGKEM